MKKIWCIIRKYLGYTCIEPKPIYVPVPTEYSGDENLLFVYINKYRQEKGLSQLIPEKLATTLAIVHVNYMIGQGKPSHDYFTDRSEESKSKHMGEICAYGYISPKSLLYAYLNSPNHKKILNDPKYTHIGLSIKNKYNCCEFLLY